MKQFLNFYVLLICSIHFHLELAWANNATIKGNDSSQQVTGVALPQPMDFCDVNPDAINTASIAFLFVVMVINLAGNGLVVTVIFLSKSLRNQKTNLFLFSLAVADILVGLLSTPIKIKQHFHNQYFCMSEAMCWFYFFEDTTLTIVSITHLLLVACDRFVAVQFTYDYDTWVTKKRVYIAIVVNWICAICWCCTNIVDWTNPSQLGVYLMKFAPVCTTPNKIFFTTIYAFMTILVVTMIVMYTFIYRQAVRHIRAIALCEVQDTATEKANRRRQREFKALRAIVIVFVAFCVCWVPNVGVALSGFWDLEYWQNLFITDHDSFVAISFICYQVLPSLNPTLNPFIYVLFNTQFRIAFKALFNRFCGNKEEFNKVDRRMTFFSNTSNVHRKSSAGIDNLDFKNDDGQNAISLTPTMQSSQRKNTLQVPMPYDPCYGTVVPPAHSVTQSPDGSLHDSNRTRIYLKNQ